MIGWNVNLSTRTATHSSGVAVRFGSRGADGAIDGAPVAGLEQLAAMQPQQAARLMREAGDAFCRALKKRRERFVYHVTLTTGHTRKSYRDEVDDEAVEVCRALIAHAIDGARPVIPGTDRCRLAAETSRKRGLLCSVREPQHDKPIITFAIAPNSLSAAVLWRVLVETARTPVVPMECPPAPYCAVRLEQGAVAHAYVLPVLADFERCIAWAWMENRK